MTKCKIINKYKKLFRKIEPGILINLSFSVCTFYARTRHNRVLISGNLPKYIMAVGQVMFIVANSSYAFSASH